MKFESIGYKIYTAHALILCLILFFGALSLWNLSLFKSETKKQILSLENQSDNSSKIAILNAIDSSKNRHMILITLGLTSVTLLGIGVACFTKHKISTMFARTITDLSEISTQAIVVTEQTMSEINSLTQKLITQSLAHDKTKLSINELADSRQNHVNQTNQVKVLADEAKSDTIAAISEMKVILEQIQKLHFSNSDVSDITKAINDVASQTNQLALKISTEAAKTGTHSDNFSSVAEEVRRLAQKAILTARETEQKIHLSMANADKATSLSKVVAKNLENVSTKITDVHKLADDSVSSALLLAQSLTALQQAFEQQTISIKTNTHQSEQIAESTGSLLDHAEITKDLIHELKSHIGHESPPLTLPPITLPQFLNPQSPSERTQEIIPESSQELDQKFNEILLGCPLGNPGASCPLSVIRKMIPSEQNKALSKMSSETKKQALTTHQHCYCHRINAHGPN